MQAMGGLHASASTRSCPPCPRLPPGDKYDYMQRNSLDIRSARSQTPITWTFEGPARSVPGVYCYRQDQDRDVTCLVSRGIAGENEWHVSLKHPRRRPRSEEISSAIRAFVPDEVELRQLDDDAVRRPAELGYVVQIVEP